MNLHENPDVFEELILATASELRIPTSVVEKDYFVTIVLKLLTSRIENIVFKNVPYELAIGSLKQVIAPGLWK